MRVFLLIALVVVLSVGLVSCGGEEEDSQPDSVAADVAGGDGTVFVTQEITPDDDGFGGFDFRGDGVGFEFVPEQGGFLWPCNEGADCLSSYCIQTQKYGEVCTIYCELECPLNWKCKEQKIGADPVFLCIAPETDLCRTCEDDDDCGSPVDLCLTLGAKEERVCGIACADAGECPDGYACTTIETEGSPVKQCAPDAGSCECLGDLNGTSEACSVENEFGKCYGESMCDGANGWTECSALDPAAEDCDGIDNDCDGAIDEDLDSESCSRTNEMGVCEANKVCEGAAGWICPAPEPALEICDGVDNNCDGDTDESYPEDGEACDSPEDDDKCAYGTYACDQEAGALVCLDDTLSPEVCDGVDNDCNGLTDELFDDTDDDGEADCIDPDDDNDTVLDGDDNCPLVANPDGIDSDVDGMGDACDDDDDNDGALDGDDCAPTDPLVHPGVTEVCNGKDDDCDGLTDPSGTEGCKKFYIDADKDGFGFDALMECVCGEEGTPPYSAVQGGDCNDSDGEVNPLAAEVCNSKDDDCDDDVDNFGAAGCVSKYKDHDQDGYGLHYDQQCVCGSKGEYSASEAYDCDDNDKDKFPGADEFCNGVDDNCNNQVDESGSLGCNNYYLDQDNDGYGATDFFKCMCKGKGDYDTEKSGDCNDSDKTINPGGPEVCSDGKDNDCDGVQDEPQCVGSG